MRTNIILLLFAFLISFVFSKTETNSTQCMTDIDSFLNGSYVSSTVTSAMKASSGLEIFQFGNYDQCEEISSQIAQYCIAIGTFSGNSGPFVGICVPSSCSESNLQIFATFLIATAKIDGSVTQIHCNNQHPKPSLSVGGIICVIILVLCFTLVLLGSLLFYFQTIHLENYRTTINSAEETRYLINPNSLIEEEVKKQNNPFWLEFFICFSIQNNLSFLANDKNSSGALGMLNGLRVLMMFWVILGHTIFFAEGTVGYDNVSKVYNKFQHNFSFQFIYAAEFAVDVFFYLSGFLVTYLTYREMITGRVISWIYYYVHRYWRLTPVYIFILFLSFTFVPAIGGGPFWFLYNLGNYEGCAKYWWTNLLYINNLYPEWGDGCFSSAWYLANDMQFFLVVPFILFLHCKNKKLSYSLIALFLGLCFCMNVYLMSHYYKKEGPQEAGSIHIYAKPYTRCAPYLLGIVNALIVLDYKGWILAMKSWKIRWAMYLVSFAIVMFCSYATINQSNWNETKWVLYTTFSRFSFTLAISMFALICMGGYGGILNWILSAPFWAPLAKLTYCAYLIHPTVMETFYLQQTRQSHYSWTETTYAYIGNLGLAYSLALVFHLLVEKPCSNIERLVMKSKKR